MKLTKREVELILFKISLLNGEKEILESQDENTEYQSLWINLLFRILNESDKEE